ncbi:hypothetical protein EBR21_05345 [bacterium]|nr:hypothetical protein [bacterium]
MSVAEFAIAMPIVLICVAGVHELFRIQAAENTLNVIATARAAELSYMNLQNILNGTFSSEKNQHQETLERKIGSLVAETFQSPLLVWRFSAGDIRKPPISGIKVTVNGPSFRDRQARTEVRIHVCLKSWIEPLLRILSDGRNCLGQYTSGDQADAGRGIQLKGFASREPSISLIPYFKSAKMEQVFR